MKFIVSEKFLEKVPNAVFGVIVAKNINNKIETDFIEKEMNQQIEKVSNKFEGKTVKETYPITLYRDAFRNIDINPNKFMCSIEALTTRVVKTKKLPNINAIVDIGNTLSIKYLIPLGIHDIDKLTDDIMIRPANENDKFIPFGSTDTEIPDLGEIVYVSGNDVKTRKWTWRQGENGKITEEVKNVFIPLDCFDENKNDMLELQSEFKVILEEKFGAEVSIGIIDKDNKELEF